MSKLLTDNAIASFDAMVKQAYQNASLLNGTYRVKAGVVGSTHRFPKIGKGLAQQRIPQTDVVPMNIAHTSATATLEDWDAPEYTDIFDQAEVNYSEQKELVEVIAGALGRRRDQLVLDAMATSANATQVGVNIGGTNTGFNVAKILRLKRLMDDAGVPNDKRRHVAVSAQAIEQALAISQFGSIDFNIFHALAEGTLPQYAGFIFHVIETRTEGGLVLTSTTRNCFGWHMDAVGLAEGLAPRTNIDWIAEKTSWLVNGYLKAGSVSIDIEGIYDLLIIE